MHGEREMWAERKRERERELLVFSSPVNRYVKLNAHKHTHPHPSTHPHTDTHTHLKGFPRCLHLEVTMSDDWAQGPSHTNVMSPHIV